MKVSIETYRIISVTAIVCLSIKLLAPMIKLVTPLNDYLHYPMIFAGLFGVILALTNLKRDSVEFFWKKKAKVLKVPLRAGKHHKIIAYDEEGNRYKIGPLFLPKKI